MIGSFSHWLEFKIKSALVFTFPSVISFTFGPENYSSYHSRHIIFDWWFAIKNFFWSCCSLPFLWLRPPFHDKKIDTNERELKQINYLVLAVVGF
jgi:hypothetical protein